MTSRRRLLVTLASLGLCKCREARFSGSSDLLRKLANCSHKQGLAISLFNGIDVLYLQYFSEGIERKEVRLPPSAVPGPYVSASIVDWGHELAILNSGWLRIIDLSGSLLNELRLGDYIRDGSISRCVFHKESGRLIFWGATPSPGEYGIFLWDLSDGKVRTLFRMSVAPGARSPGINGWAVAGKPVRIGFCVDFENYVLRSDSTVAKMPWQIELTESSPDGKFMAGRRSDGRVAVIDSRSGSVLDTGLNSIGRARWDPSSQFLFFVRGSKMPLFWWSQVVVYEPATKAALYFSPIVADDRDHSYDWVLLEELRG
jgi:hypothetical protein